MKFETTTNGNPKYPIAAGIYQILSVAGGTWFGILIAMVIIGLLPPWAWLVSAAVLAGGAVWYVAKPGVWVW